MLQLRALRTLLRAPHARVLSTTPRALAPAAEHTHAHAQPASAGHRAMLAETLAHENEQHGYEDGQNIGDLTSDAVNRRADIRFWRTTAAAEAIDTEYEAMGLGSPEEDARVVSGGGQLERTC